jgi:hypothetical protein
MDTHGSGPLVADLVVDVSPGTSLFVARPCHQRAADWLGSMVGDVPIDDRSLGYTVFAAFSAGFNVSLPFEGQPRVLGGLPAAPNVVYERVTSIDLSDL